MPVDVVDEVAFDDLSSHDQHDVVAMTGFDLQRRVQRLMHSGAKLTHSRISNRERAGPPTLIAQLPQTPSSS
jgi:hypothetical protein